MAETYKEPFWDITLFQKSIKPDLKIRKKFFEHRNLLYHQLFWNKWQYRSFSCFKGICIQAVNRSVCHLEKERHNNKVCACILKWGAFTYYEHIVYREGFVLNCSIWFTVWCSRVSWWNKRRRESNLHKAWDVVFHLENWRWDENKTTYSYLAIKMWFKRKIFKMLHAAAAGGETQFSYNSKLYASLPDVKSISHHFSRQTAAPSTVQYTPHHTTPHHSTPHPVVNIT